MSLPVVLEERHPEMITTYPLWCGGNHQLPQGEAQSLWDTGRTPAQEMCEFSSYTPHGGSSTFVYLQQNKECNVEQQS